jgi:hypothetical protein
MLIERIGVINVPLQFSGVSQRISFLDCTQNCLAADRSIRSSRKKTDRLSAIAYLAVQIVCIFFDYRS